tara:strand:- start:92 stop:1165 length:1074 start_codon:yes stop_codon:yes gene_type:complete
MAQVADYDVENDTGAQVRGDINNIFGAIKSCNSGSSNPPLPVEFMLYGDESDKILKVFSSTNGTFTEIGNINQDNLGLLPRDGTAPMSAGLSLIAGLANNLSLKFSGDTDTGLFRAGSNALGIVAGGTERVRVDSNGLKVRNGHSIQIFSSGNGNRIDFDFAGSSDINFALPTADGANGSVLQTNGSGQLSFVAIQGVPTGTIFCFAIATVPTGYLECNGQSTSGYTALAALIGSNVPDLRGEFVRGWASNTNDSTRDQGREIGSGQSSDITSHNHGATSTSTVSDPGHVHRVRVGTSGTGGGNVSDRDSQNPGNFVSNQIESSSTGISVSTSTTTSNTGGSETRPRNVALMYIIKT